MDVNEQNVQNLSEGISNMPRRMTSREILGDIIFVNLQIFARILFIIMGVGGYYFYKMYGVVLLGCIGWFIGSWIRYSLGIRGKDPDVGFFVRMKERAQGSRRGMLEWLMEKIRGNEFSLSKCIAISKAYEHAVNELAQQSSSTIQAEILKRLDQKVKKRSYDS